MTSLTFHFPIFLKRIFINSGCAGSQLWHAGSFVGAHRYSSCGIQAHQLWHVGLLSCSAACGILVSQPGIEPVSPVLQGGFLTTGPAEKSLLIFTIGMIYLTCFPGGSVVKNLPAQTGHGLMPSVGKISWRKKWQPTPVFLPGKFHGWRSLEGYCPGACKETDTTQRLNHHHNLPHGVVLKTKQVIPEKHFLCDRHYVKCSLSGSTFYWSRSESKQT